MNKKVIILIVIQFILLNAVCIYAQNFDAQLKDLFQQKTEFKRDVYYRIQKFIEDNPDSPSLANLYFYLAELSTEIDIDDPGKTVEYYIQVLEHDPTFLQKDVVLYNIGYYGFQKELNERDEKRIRNIDKVMNWPDDMRLSVEQLDYTLYALNQLIVRNPDSEYYARAAYRLGVIYFDIALDARQPQQYFEKAVAYFDQVAKADDPLKYLGLFQRGWTYFTSGKFDRAIEDFSTILTLIKEDQLTESKAFFEDDAIENIAFSLIEYDGADYEQYSEAAVKAKELFKDFVSVEFGQKILLEAIKLKIKYNAPMQAADIYGSYIELYPDAIGAPLMVDSIMTIYKSYPSRTRGGVAAEDLVIEEYKRLIYDFSYDSAWYENNFEDEISTQLAIIKEAYQFLEPKYFNAFADDKTENNFNIYKELALNYRNYEAIVDSEMVVTLDERLVYMIQDLAEILQQPNYYLKAIDESNTFIANHPNHPNIDEYNEMVFYNNEQIYSQLKPIVLENAYVDTLAGIHIDKAELDSLFTRATLDYEDYLFSRSAYDQAANEKLIGVIYQRAELKYENENYDEAYPDYEKLITLQINDDVRKVANSRLAEISRIRNDYSSAESFYREAAKYATAEEKENLNTNILATKQAKATTFSNASNFEQAALEYLELAAELENKNIDESIAFIVKAIESYKQIGDLQKAIDLYRDIASKSSEKDDVLAAYINAWTISDSIPDWTQSEQLRMQFISKYPASNEAYKLKVHIIGFYENQDIFNNKEEAAEMYLDLHRNADNMDIGNAAKSSIFLNALRLYQELDMENKITELSLQFNDLYPEHERANDLLIKVASIYKENGETDKFEEIATVLYKKDPSINLLVTVAVQSLKNIKSEVDSLFNEKHYNLMTAKMDEFKTTEENFIEKGLDLPTDAIYDEFKDYNDYAAYYNDFDNKMNDFAPDILGANPNSLIRVNELTKWSTHLVKGKKRIPKLLERCDSVKDETIELIQTGDLYDLPKNRRTEALYHVAEVYEYSSDVVTTQIKKFVDVSDQLNNERMQQNVVQQQQYKKRILGFGREKSLDFRKRAVQIYYIILGQFSPNDEYSDEWIVLTKNRLIELGLRSPKIIDHIFTDSTWNFTVSQIDNISAIPTSSWNRSNTLSYLTILDSAEVIPISQTGNILTGTSFESEIKPELVTLEYVYQEPVDIFINNVLLETEPELQDEFIRVENDLKPHYIVKDTKLLQDQVNEIYFKIERDSSAIDTLLFAAKFNIQYDKNELEFARTTEEKQIITDNSWVAHLGENIFSQESISNATVSDTTEAQMPNEDNVEWVNISDADFEYYKNQMYGLEDSDASGIWHPELDSTKTQTITLKKEFYIDNEVVSASAAFIAQNMASIWINDEILIDSDVIMIDETLKKVQSKTFEISNLKPGWNTIIAEVQGAEKYKGFILDLKYIVRQNTDSR